MKNLGRGVMVNQKSGDEFQDILPIGILCAVKRRTLRF